MQEFPNLKKSRNRCKANESAMMDLNASRRVGTRESPKGRVVTRYMFILHDTSSDNGLAYIHILPRIRVCRLFHVCLFVSGFFIHISVDAAVVGLSDHMT